MSKNRSKWKNGPDGKTVRRNSVAEYFASRPVELLGSFALRTLSRTEHLALIRIELELRQHAGRCNGNLIITKQQFTEFGVHRHLVAPALRALEALGIVMIKHGRGGNAEHRQPNRFMLNFLCGAIDAHELITNSWKRFKTPEEADAVAIAARNHKDPHKVAYGRRNAEKENISGPQKVGPKPAPKSGPETEKFSAPKSGPTGPGPKTGPTPDISGGGGDEAAGFRRVTEQGPAEPAWTTPQLTELPWSKYWQRLYRKLEPEEACRYCGEVTSKSALIELCQDFFIHPECVEDWRNDSR
jgi:hypothetical protein